MKWFLPIVLVGLMSCSRSEKSLGTKKDSPLSPVVATSSVDKALISTEDVLTFSVVFNRDAPIDLPIPDIGGLIKGFRITDFGSEEKEEDKRKITRKWYSLRADVAGSYILPEIEVHYTDSGKEKTAKTSEIFVEVKAPSAAAADSQEDIRELKGLEITPTHYLAWFTGIALVCTAVGLGVFFYTRRNRKPQDIKRLPPHEDALNRLEAIAIPNESDVLALKRYYFSLSEIIRTYVEDRYGFRATDMTSEEIVRNLHANSPLPEAEKPIFIDFLKETDVVKFTDFYPAHEAIVAAKERVKTFVIQTKPVIAETESVV